jgi:ubiquinone/menaquinone biosynthesis C-methylase UbiE
MLQSEKFSAAEKQLITTLSWFRSRYAIFIGLKLDRKANKQSIVEFGKTWIGYFKENWDDSFISLSEKGVLINIAGEYLFTEYGELVKNEVEAETPFYKYEYDNYFTLDKFSNAHSVFCEKVYGVDLSQHGLIDQGELSVLIAKLLDFKPSNILDVGCGNGRITEWISLQTQTHCVGVDISSEAVKFASERSEGNNKLQFLEGNLNDLKGLKEHDCILFLDTLYYANNLTDTLRQTFRLLTPQGRIYAYFSQWIMDVLDKESLHADNTHLAKSLRELNVNYSYTNLTNSGIDHWKKKLETLELMKKDFLDEGRMDLWQYRFLEANRYANWGVGKYSRYLYEIDMNNNQADFTNRL